MKGKPKFVRDMSSDYDVQTLFRSDIQISEVEVPEKTSFSEVSFAKQFGLEYECFTDEKEYKNYNPTLPYKIINGDGIQAITYSLASELYQRPAASVWMSMILLVKTVNFLKEHGTARVVTTRGVPRQFNFSYGANILLSFRPHESRYSPETIFFLFSELESLPSEDYPEYQDCVLQGEIPYVNGVSVFFNPKHSEAAIQLLNKINEDCQFEHRTVPCVEMIVATSTGLHTKAVEVEYQQPTDQDLDLHYGTEFSTFNSKLVERLLNTDKGIVMFHGPPGTGKTFYIRSLLPRLAGKKRVLLVPKHILSHLESPEFSQFMINNFINEKIIFVIEDSESVIAKRTAEGDGRSHLISTILNVTDGILNDIFNIQVILTFNTDLKLIDEALLRKGRLIAKYNFDLLPHAQALQLAKRLEVNLPSHQDRWSLADIYALRQVVDDEILINQNLNKKVKSSVGF